MLTITSPNDLSLVSNSDYYIVSSFDNRYYQAIKSSGNIAMTLIAMFLIFIFSFFISMDIKEYFLMPLEDIMIMLSKLREDPIANSRFILEYNDYLNKANKRENSKARLRKLE